MKSPSERGPYGRWLVASRLDRNLATAEKARQALLTAGIEIAKSTYAEYEAGTKAPSKRHLPLLERFFGPFVEQADSAPPDDLAGAIRALTAELAEMRREREAWTHGVEAVVARLVEQDLAARAAPPVPRETTGSGR